MQLPGDLNDGVNAARELQRDDCAVYVTAFVEDVSMLWGRAAYGNQGAWLLSQHPTHVVQLMNGRVAEYATCRANILGYE